LNRVFVIFHGWGSLNFSLSLSKNVKSSDMDYLRSPELIVIPEARINLSPEVLETLTQLLAHSLKYVFITGFAIALIAFLSSFLMPKGIFHIR